MLLWVWQVDGSSLWRYTVASLVLAVLKLCVSFRKFHQLSSCQVKEDKIVRGCITYETWEMHTKFWSEDRKVRDQAEDLDVDGRKILEWILGKQEGEVWTGCIWLRMRTSGRLLWTRKWGFGYFKMCEISWLVESSELMTRFYWVSS
jgi:hypothetical protein